MRLSVFSPLSRWYDQRPQRERVVLLIGFLIVLILLMNFLVMQPYADERDAARRKVVELKTSLAELHAQEIVIEARKENDPDRKNRLRLEALEREAAHLQEQLEANIVNLVSPRDMPELLKDLLTRQKKIKLISLENLPPELLELDPQAVVKSTAPTLYRHRLQMTFSGDYLTLLKYLRQLEELPRAMVWEEVDIESQDYPEATVRLHVYTLSLTEGWIGG